MKIFLYTLKVWATVVMAAFGVHFFSLIVTPRLSDFPVSPFIFVFGMASAYAAPFALTVWITAAQLYKKDIPVKKKKRRLLLWGSLALLVAMNFMPAAPVYFAVILGVMLASFVFALFFFRLPSRQPLTVTDNLKGRHILLRIHENNLLLRGTVLSELNIWPIKIKLQDNSPHSLLDLHSFQEDELFTSLNYQTSVKVKVFTPDRKEFLFTGTLELDHTLN